MALNPFFLQGSKGEQGLVQDLVNEQLRMYGIECHYIPRKLVTSSTIMKEVTESRFDQAFPLETYLMNTDGYAGQGDILTKFGVRVTDEATFVISKERFEESVAPFLEQDDEYTLSNRPKEGDLIFFPLGKRMFEIKFVEVERPFYQLGRNYVWECQCELFEYSDEEINTGITELDAIETAFANAITVGLVAGGTGDFTVGETVTGGSSNVTAEVKSWDNTTRTLIVINRSGTFTVPETLTGGTSGASFTTATYNTIDNANTEYDQNNDFETLDNQIIDFTEANPFGSVGSITDNTI